MQGLHFKKIPGGRYTVLFYVGDFFVPVEEELLKEIKKRSNTSNEEFLKLIAEKLGSNTYLKDAIQEVIKQSGDPADLAKTLQRELEAL